MAGPRTLAALGGGGFSMEPENLALDRWLLSLTGKERPRVLFVPAVVHTLSTLLLELR